MNLNKESFNSFYNDYLDELSLIKKNKKLSSLESELAKNPDEAIYERYIALKNS